MDNNKYALKITDLTKRYGGFKKSPPILDGLNISVKTSEIFGFLGPNGSGKTTTIKCVLGLVFPDRGFIEILGLPAGNAASRERIGFLPEEATFPGHLKGVEILRSYSRLLDIPDRETRIEEVLAAVGLEGRANSLVGTYSKGMRQRLGMAQALLNDPELLILDEPLSGLDPLGRTMMKDIILGLREKGKTIFLSSHQLLETEQICDRIGILCRGRLVAEETLAKLNPDDGNRQPSGLEKLFIETMRQNGIE